jgi:magnesium-transporting ATPase (P-type)
MFDVQEIAVRVAIRCAAIVFVLAMGFAIRRAYRRLRRPNWAENWFEIKVPWGAWIIAALLILVVTYLVFVIFRNPLAI